MKSLSLGELYGKEIERESFTIFIFKLSEEEKLSLHISTFYIRR